jgi:hypothetical protein
MKGAGILLVIKYGRQLEAAITVGYKDLSSHCSAVAPSVKSHDQYVRLKNCVLDCRFSVQSMRVLKISLKCSDTLLIYISDELCNSLTQSTRQIETWLSEISNGLWWIKVTCVHSLFGLRCLSYF